LRGFGFLKTRTRFGRSYPIRPIAAHPAKSPRIVPPFSGGCPACGFPDVTKLSRTTIPYFLSLDYIAAMSGKALSSGWMKEKIRLISKVCEDTVMGIDNLTT